MLLMNKVHKKTYVPEISKPYSLEKINIGLSRKRLNHHILK